MRRTIVVILTAAAWMSTAPAPTVAPAAATAAPAVAVTGRQFLEYDPVGDGRAIEVVGDIARATRIAIVIPGVDTTVANFDRGLGGVERRAPAFQARQLQREMTAAASGEEVAVVAWLGYDPPEGVGLAAVREDRARAGAADLVTFVETMVGQYPMATFTIVGHSYGSVVAGRAAPYLPAAVTDIVAIGSPGMGVSKVADLHTGARVWAGTAHSDWTRRIPGLRVLGLGHGTRPATKEFGARALPVEGVEGHDGYFVSGTASLRAMAQIAVHGQLDLA